MNRIEQRVAAICRPNRPALNLGICLIVGLPVGSTSGQPSETITFPPSPTADLERTCFQAAAGWNPAYDIRSDVAIVYGVNESLDQRIAGYRQRGYRIHVMTGRFLDLFDPNHTVQSTFSIPPGQRRLLIDLERVGNEPRVLASASRVTEWDASRGRITFLSKGPSDTFCTTSCLVPAEPIHVEADGNKIDRTRYTETPAGGVVQFSHPNTPDGVRITIRLKTKG